MDDERQGEQVQGFCMRCKRKTDFTDVQEVVLRNNRPAIRGRCAECGGRVAKMLPKVLADI